MSTPGAPGTGSTQPASWVPNLSQLGLPKALVTAVQQGIVNTNSVRDAVTQHQSTTKHMLQYGTHLERTQANPQSVQDGSLWFETDNGTIFYQSRLNSNQTTNSWFLAGGMATGSMANRPTYVGSLDMGFLYFAIDSGQLWFWTGTSWIVVG